MFSVLDGRILTRVTGPQNLLSLAEAKAQLRAIHEEEDAHIADLVASATAELDGPEGMYGYAVADQRWQIATFGPDVNGRLALPITPVRSLFSVAYWPVGGGAQVVHTSAPDLANWKLWAGDNWAYVVPSSNVWPGFDDRQDAVTIQFNAGYSPVPVDVKQACRLVLTNMYENRSTMVASGMRESPALENLVAKRRRYWLG